MLVRDVANVVQQTPANHVANLLDSGFRVDVSEVDGPVAQVVDASGRSGHSRRRNGLLGECVGDQVPVSRVEDVRISRRNPQELGSILLLGLGHVGTAVLAVEDPFGGLPLGLLRQLGNCFHRVANGQEMDKPNAFLLHKFDGINGAKLPQLLPQLLFRHILWQVPNVNIARRARLLHSKRYRGRYLRGLSPAHLDVVALDGQLLQDRVGVEVGGRIAVEERNEGAVLVRKESHRLNLAATDVVENLFCRRLSGNVTQVHGTARPREKARGDRCRRTSKGSIAQTPHTVDRRLRATHQLLVAHVISWDHS